jgi:hypothetical protein
MYTNDYDDEAPLLVSYNGTGLPFTYGPPYGEPITWSFATTPYIKSGQLFTDPLAGNDNGFAANGASYFFTSASEWDEWSPQYGYNSPLLNSQNHNATGGLNPNYQPNSMTSFSRPADFVMLTDAASTADAGYTYYVDGGVTNFSGIEPPYCFNGCSDLWYGEWFTNPTGYGYGGMQTNVNEGSATGGVAWRKGGLVGGLTNVAFCDHVDSNNRLRIHSSYFKHPGGLPLVPVLRVVRHAGLALCLGGVVGCGSGTDTSASPTKPAATLATPPGSNAATPRGMGAPQPVGGPAADRAGSATH